MAILIEGQGRIESTLESWRWSAIRVDGIAWHDRQSESAMRS